MAPVFSMRSIFGIELGAIVVVTLCCFVDPPFPLSVVGPVTFEDSVEIYVAGKVIQYLDQPVNPADGQTVLIDYQDHINEQVVLSVTTDPGTPAATTYLTQAGKRYQRWLWLSYLALAGLAAGLAVTCFASARLVVLGRREGALARGLTAALAPLSVLGGVPLLANVFSLSGSQIVIKFAAAVWLMAGLTTLFVVYLTDRHGVRLAVANLGLTVFGAASALWILGWVGYIVWIIINFSSP